jgi:transcriptional regulator with XRE-family HTH domain
LLYFTIECRFYFRIFQEDAMFNLKEFREHYTDVNGKIMTQEEFAQFIGKERDAVYRLEKDPSQIPLELLMVIAEKTGTTLDQLVGYEKPKPEPFVIEDAWKTAEITRKILKDHINTSWDRVKSSFGEQERVLVNKDSLFRELSSIIETNFKKPKIAFVGRSDVGKSAIINSLLGKEIMPTAWNPTTSIVVYIKHINDRPSFIVNEDVWIFKREENSPACNDTFLNDEEKCLRLKLAAGGRDALRGYGTRQGEHSMDDAAAAVVFLDSEILKNCDLIDLPGYGTGDRDLDDRLTIEAKKEADVLVYMSLANGFMRYEDIAYLKEAIQALPIIGSSKDGSIPPVGNLFILASQAHTVDGGNPEALQKILNGGCERFNKTISPRFWFLRDEVSGYNNARFFRGRFFTYAIDKKNLRKNFEDDLRKLMELLPKWILQKTIEKIKNFSTKAGIDLDMETRTYESMRNKQESYRMLLQNIEKNETYRRYENLDAQVKICSEIKSRRDESIEEFSRQYREIINADFIAGIIIKQNYGKRKEDLQLLSSYISSELEACFHSILTRHSKDISGHIEKYIAVFDNVRNKENNSMNLTVIPFDTKSSFNRGLKDIPSPGALAYWASALGAGNLIFNNNDTFEASAVHIAGAAAVGAVVTALLGPIVLAVTMAVLVTVAVFNVLSKGLEKSLAKKIVRAYDDENTLEKYKKAIVEFWDATESAFNKATAGMENEWKVYVNNLRSLANTVNMDEIKANINANEELKRIFTDMPLPSV